MAKSDIVARLQLDSKDYEKKLAQAKASTKKFSKDGGAGLSDMVGKFKTLAGAVAASKAVMEVFNGAIKASQTVGDEYTRVIESAKSVTNQFFYAITTGDFTTFDKGLREMIKNAREATRALDDLGTNRIVLGYLKDKYQAGFQESITDARNKGLSVAERKAAASAARSYLEAYAQQINQDRGIALKAIQNLIVEGGGPANASIETIDRVLANYYTLGEEYKAAYEQVKRLHTATEARDAMNAEYRKTWKGQQEVSAYNKEIIGINNLIKANKQLYDDAKIFNVFFNRWQDESLQANLQIIRGIEQGERELASWENTLNEVANQLNQPIKPGTVGDVIDPSRYKPQGLGSMAGVGAATVSPLTERIGGFAPVAVWAEGSYEAYVAAREGALEYADALAVLEAQEMGAADGLMAIGDVVGSVGGLLGEGGAAWADYVGGIVSAVSSALPALEALAAAQAAAAVTKTALSPWTAIGAVAAVASVAAAMANIPKFATGGVVPGNALSGDNVLIRANSGEVVLTKQQASNIGSLLGRGGEVTFKIKGDTLVGILNNHNKIASRSYGR